MNSTLLALRDYGLSQDAIPEAADAILPAGPAKQPASGKGRTCAAYCSPGQAPIRGRGLKEAAGIRARRHPTDSSTASSAGSAGRAGACAPGVTVSGAPSS